MNTDIVRRNVRCDVRRHVEGFLREATEEDVWFLREVLMAWDNRSGVQGKANLAEAFSECLGPGS